MKHNAGSEDDDVSLRLIDLFDTFLTIAFFLNPLNIFTFFWKLFTGQIDFSELEFNEEKPGENENDYYKEKK